MGQTGPNEVAAHLRQGQDNTGNKEGGTPDIPDTTTRDSRGRTFPFSFTQEGFAHKTPNRDVHKKHSDTGNQEDKQGTIKGQENEEAGDR